MRILGLLSIVAGAVMFIVGVQAIASATSANLLSIALSVILGVGGTIMFIGGLIVLAVMSAPKRPVDDRTGPIPTIS